MASALRKAMVKPQSKPCGSPPQGLLRTRAFALECCSPSFRILQSWNLNGGTVDLVFVPFFATGNLGSDLDRTRVTSGTVPLVTLDCVTALRTIAVIVVAGVANCG